MPFKNRRNSRDDKSEKFNRPSSGKPGRGEAKKSDRTEGSNNDRRKLFGGDLKKKFGTGSASGKGFEKRAENPFRKDKTPGGSRPFSKDGGKARPFRKDFSGKPEAGRSQRYRSDEHNWTTEERFTNKRPKKAAEAKDDGLIRLNRFIANAGVCSRRKADELIAAGVVSVNGEAVTELGYKVDPSKDIVRYNGETLKREKLVYVLLNKPKDYITTTDDPQERKTVMALVEKASKERIYPVGRLDRNTTGLLLMTNDGDLADKLSHPRKSVTKLYHVELNKSLTQGDLNKISYGLELEDGLIKPDQISYVAGGSKREVGIQIHSGKNRIVRRIFESLGYEVVKLDRVVYSTLTKKDLPRGRWRYLTDKEISQMKALVR